MGDRHHDQLVDAVLVRERQEALLRRRGSAGDRAPARVADDGQLERRVGMGQGLLDRGIRPGPAGPEPHQEEVAAPGQALRLRLRVGAHGEGGHARPRRVEPR